VLNPNYKGKWETPEIPNPDYEAAAKSLQVGRVCGSGNGDSPPPCTHLLVELHATRSGSVLDSVAVADSVSEANGIAEDAGAPPTEAEKAQSSAAAAAAKGTLARRMASRDKWVAARAQEERELRAVVDVASLQDTRRTSPRTEL
jgi:hypothetical protein